MNNNKLFTIDREDGSSIVARVMTTFEYMGNKYCIYSIPNGDSVSIYCAKNIEGDLIKIVNEEEQSFVNGVVHKLVKAVGTR